MNLGQQLPDHGDSAAEITADQQRRSAQAEVRADAKPGRQSPNYNGNEIATAATATISDLEGTNLLPEMMSTKKSSALQEAGRKVMQDSKNSLAAFTVASHNTTQALHDLKFSKK